MNIKTLSFGCAALAASVVMGAAVDFPGAGGDLASAKDWGGTRPAATESVNLINAGTYALSEDVTFSQLLIPTAGSTLSFGAKTFTITSTGNFGFHFTAPGLTVVDGGTFDLSGKANFHGAYNNYKGQIHTVLTNGCVVTNVNCFYAARYSEGNTTKVTGGSKVYTEEIRLTNDNSYDNTFEVSGGAEIHLTNRFYFDVNATTKGVHGGNRFIVRDPGSLYEQTNGYMMQLGYQQHDDIFWVTDGARATSANGGVNVGGSAPTTNSLLRVDNGATASFKEIDVVGRYGHVQVCDGGSLTLKTLSFKGSDNDLIVSNATFACNPTKASEVSCLGSSATVSNNVIRAIGADTAFTLYTSAGVHDLYGAGHHNTVSIEDGAAWPVSVNVMMTNTHHSVLRVTGENSRFGKAAGDGNFYFGCHKDFLSNRQDSVSNRVCVSDGAAFNVSRFVMAGIGNRLVVSNATVTLTADSVGFRSGYENGVKVHDDNGLILQGATPKVRSLSSTSQNAFWFQNNSLLRFEIPEEGYADGFVPIELGCSFYLDETNTRVEIECAKFVEKTGGKLHLIHAGSNISAAIVNFLKNNVVLPEGARLIIDGKDVYLKSPKRTGLSVIIR